MASPPPHTHSAVVLHSAKNLTVSQIPTPPLQPHEVTIAPRATGICGTDLHYYQNGANGIYTIRTPLILGHEAAGTIVAVGFSVTGFQPGDRVVLEPQLSCQSCKQCRSGRYNLCPDMRFRGSASAEPPAQGSLQELVNHPASLVYHLPSTLSYSEGAIVEPLSVALHSVRKAGVEAGHSVLITGAGAVGLLCARVARISGASAVVIADIDENRLRFAKQQGLATCTLLIPTEARQDESKSQFSARMARQVVETLGGEPHLALECTGVETCLNVCIGAVVAGAKVILVGMGAPRQEINLGLALVREIEIVGIWRYANTFQAAIDLIDAGMVDVKALVTHQFDLADVKRALEFALSRPKDLVKCVITSGDQGT